MSNKMPKADVAVTAWVRRYVYLPVGLLLLIVLSAALYSYQKNECSGGANIGSKCIQLERVITPEAQARGLSGRERLPEGHGMLFDFARPGTRCMWMKDMRFSLDMLWLDEEGRILKIEESVSPDTYPKTYCADGSRYVLEVNSGTVQNARIVVGDLIKL